MRGRGFSSQPGPVSAFVAMYTISWFDGST
jgi:hypothetical protein